MRRRNNQRLREEMGEHLALQTEENIRAGMAPAEARRQAVLKFGAVGAVAENYHAEEGLPFIENLLQDLRYALRRSHSRVFPGAAPLRTWLFRDAIDYDLSRQRLLSSVSGGFALLALALVATGLYGILARTVTERRREIGIRMALGAQRQQIVTSLAPTAAFRVAIGVVAGAALAATAGRLMQSLLYGVTPGSPWMSLTALVVLLAVLALAFVFPAGRAAAVDPMEAIREE